MRPHPLSRFRIPWNVFYHCPKNKSGHAESQTDRGHPLSPALTLMRHATLLLLPLLLSACAAASRSDHAAMPAPGSIHLSAAEGEMDTISFHIGSPLILRMEIGGEIGCAPFNGQPFYFGTGGAQLGWDFEEVADSLLLTRGADSCTRWLLLPSDASNRLAEGYYPASVRIFIDERHSLLSDTVILHPIRATTADARSYARFLQEQILRNSPLLRGDRETIDALFSENAPRSAESEVYHALLLFRAGDIAAAADALRASRTLAARRNRPLDRAARETYDAIVNSPAFREGLGREKSAGG